ncbi:MAG: hypothetical protein LBD46_07915 [Endomicrobium sp.]|nr:hypothetical protein [Endomicrobium sp.]
MKKILIFVICLFLSLQPAFAQNKKQNSGFNRNTSTQNQKSSSRNIFGHNKNNSFRKSEPVNIRINNNSSDDFQRRKSSVVTPAPAVLKSVNSKPQLKNVKPAVTKRENVRPSGNAARNNANNPNSRRYERRKDVNANPVITKSNAVRQRSFSNNNYRKLEQSRSNNTNRSYAKSVKHNSINNQLIRHRHHIPPKRYRPRTYYPYSHYYRPARFFSAVNFLLFPFGYLSFHHHYAHHYYYTPYYTGTAVYYGYNNYNYFTSNKLSADYTMLNDDTEEGGIFYDTTSVPELSDIKIQNTRLINSEKNLIGFEIDNGSKYYIASISFKITVRGEDYTNTKSGIFYKPNKPLAPGEKEFYKISLDDLELYLPETYTIFADIESITTPSGSTITDNSTY